MKFYGTGAAEGIPDSFCSCLVCKNARKIRGKEIRKRTMFRLNKECCIDLGADSFSQSIEYEDFIDLRHVLVTHTHEDHFNYMMINVRKMATCRIKEPLHYYLTDKAYNIVDFMIKSSAIIKSETEHIIEQEIVNFHQLEFEKSLMISGMEVTALKGNHFGNMDENSANYLIKLANGELLYYGLDTGYYLEETFYALRNKRLDYLISECTFGLTEKRGNMPDGHLDAFSCIKLFEQLYQQNTITDKTKIYLTHINHYKGTHKELVEFFKHQKFANQIVVTYDGMEI